ncbi:MAG: phosphate acetyltransferase [Syntrophobacteraceae bacterium CG2_30_61_12]|nr:MAG: phosphate acetyltransferase [Syntrophobacteraceae bacterium CG2_30_61_12]
MSKSLYVAAMEPSSGKSVIVLGVMELLSRRIRRIGFFRPVIRSAFEHDRELHLILSRYGSHLKYGEMYAYTQDEARDLVAAGRYEELLKGVVGRYQAMADRCRFVLCEGTDFSGISQAFDFAFNADVAKNIGAPVLALVSGRNRSLDEIADAARVARQSFEEHGCTVVATVVNRVEPDPREAVGVALEPAARDDGSIYVLPEDPALARPTVGEIAGALDARVLEGNADQLNREVHALLIAAMQLPNFLDHVREGALIITPGDRSDIILGSLASALSDTYPNIAGIMLTGGLVPERQIQQLIAGAKRTLTAILAVETDTYTTAMKASAIQARITPTNQRKIAAALGLFEAHVDGAALSDRITSIRSVRITPIMFEYRLIERAKSGRRHIVLPEGTEPRILRAAEILLRRDVADLTLLGDSDAIQLQAGSLGLDLSGARMVDPARSEWLETFADAYHELRRHKGISRAMARDAMTDMSYFGTMMVHRGLADGMVSGAVHTTGHTIRPSFEIIKTRPGCSIVSSVFFMCLADRVLVYGDCAVNPNPNSEQLADIAVSSAETARMFGIEPRIAMLSYSTGESGAGKDVDAVREATRIVRERRPDLMVEGPIQYDAAVDASVARTKMPESAIAGRITVFIFPDLNTGNNTYKAVQRSAGAVAIGPILQGLNKPVNDLSRGCTVTDIVNTVAITAIQAQEAKAGESVNR